MLKRVVVGLLVSAPVPASAQVDTARTDTVRLEPVEVEVTRGEPDVEGLPRAISVIGLRELRLGIKTVGLDEVLRVATGILAQNRYNPSQDLRISIRGFGARSSWRAGCFPCPSCCRRPRSSSSC
jgi:iron complex outermembrane receptor protein